jgi:hypothetical protein
MRDGQPEYPANEGMGGARLAPTTDTNKRERWHLGWTRCLAGRRAVDQTAIRADTIARGGRDLTIMANRSGAAAR